MTKLSCRCCGYELIEEDEAVAAAQEEYNYTEEELKSDSRPYIYVWCPRCAVADGRLDDISEVQLDFHWEIRW